MKELYSVAISYGKVLGWIDYDSETKTATVNIANEKAKKAAEEFLATPRVIEVPHDTLMDFTPEEINPLADVESFELAITRMWDATGVQVDWSRPVDYVKEHSSY